MDKILVLDFGGQYSQLIARKVRELNVYAEIRSCRTTGIPEVLSEGYKGMIFSGGPDSVYAEGSPTTDAGMLDIGIPALGICYGAQLIAHLSGGKVSPAYDGGEYGRTAVVVDESELFEGVPKKSICWMSHTDFISEVPHGVRTTACTDKCPCAAFADSERKIYGLQFHPEVTHTEYGQVILSNFVHGICGCDSSWKMEDHLKSTVARYSEELAGKKVLLGLSGGVDSSVVAALLHRAVGENLYCVFVDHGLLRKNERELVEKAFRPRLGDHLIVADARARFLEKLQGVRDPETKRKIIGEQFIRVFEEEARRIGHLDVLAQGTIYPDVIESGKGDSAVIKSHHNVGGLPKDIGFTSIAEPLRDLFKDEVRAVGELLGLPKELVWRQPFPGPGLAVRVIGEITEEKLDLLRDADAIFREEVDKLESRPSQYFAVLTDTESVGVKGDARAYGYTVALRAVGTDDFMTADWFRLPYETLETASGRITAEIPSVTRVVYDISSKPPATVEWE
ncbi:MAG: glutamine-hydrolyzing GMP synthase [Oscillospiraceae bacterium]|nr:glutamine-hydrolyzing GMP synthase [Oscillospiraceae bacterium]